MKQVCLTQSSLARLMPMHLIVAQDGKILQYGATAAKLFAGQELQGKSFFECFKVRQPQNTKSVADIISSQGGKLHLSLKNKQKTSLKAVGMALDDQGGLLLDMSFGISVVDAIRDYNLTIGDFAATDLAVEMLYLLEAKSAAMFDPAS